MKPTVSLTLLLAPLFCFCQYTYNNLQVNFLETEDAAKAFTYDNLRLYPVYAKESFTSKFKTLGQYTSLQDALQLKKVKITEKGNGGTVNTLSIENLSSDTIIIICGDVVKGGQQDRIIEKDVVLKPKSGKKELQVFCVEAGRWSSIETRTVTHNRVQSNAAVRAPQAPQFTAHYNKGSMGLRKVVEKEKDQAKVWSKVEEINTENKTPTATKTYTALTNSADYSKKIKAYVSFFQKKLGTEKNLIGVVVVTGNKVLGCDLFATPALFNGQLPSLLHSYATEAILSGKSVTAQAAVVKTYMDKILKDEATQMATLKEKGTVFAEGGKKLRVSCFD